MNEIFFWVIAVIMMVVGIASNYTNWKQYKASVEAKKIFVENHKDAKTEKLSTIRIWLFEFLAGACVMFAGVMWFGEFPDLTESAKMSQILVYVGLAVFCIAMVPEARMNSTIVYTADGFMFETQYIRFKMLNEIFQTNSFFKQDKMIFAGNKEEIIPKSVAKWADPMLLEYQKNRKAARKKGRNRQK